MKPEFSLDSFEKYSNIKFHENPSDVSRVVSCGRTDRHDETLVAFHNFGNAPKNFLSTLLFGSVRLSFVSYRTDFRENVCTGFL